MKLTRLTTLAFTAVALAGSLGAQQRGGNAQHAQAPRAQAPRAQASRAQAPRAYAQDRARPQQYAQSRSDFRSRNDVRARNDFNGRNDYRGDVRGRVAVASHGRPLITRAGFRDVRYGSGFRYWNGINRFGARIALPLNWYRPLYVHGFFPASYYDYCEAVPSDLDYMLPPMYDGYNSCLVGDRIVVYDRFSRGISFVAVIP